MLHENDNRNAHCFKMTSLGTIFNLKGLIHSFRKEMLIKSVMTCLGFKGNHSAKDLQQSQLPSIRITDPCAVPFQRSCDWPAVKYSSHLVN